MTPRYGDAGMAFLFCNEEFCQILLQIYAVAGRKGVCAHAGPVSLPQVWGTGN